MKHKQKWKKAEKQRQTGTAHGGREKKRVELRTSLMPGLQPYFPSNTELKGQNTLRFSLQFFPLYSFISHLEAGLAYIQCVVY